MIYIMSVEDILDEFIKEVNVYLGGCGDVRIGCLIDCIGGGALLTTDV